LVAFRAAACCASGNKKARRGKPRVHLYLGSRIRYDDGNDGQANCDAFAVK
jgi:hypothetical protein